MNRNTTELTIAVYIRPQQLPEPIGAKIDTLQGLESADQIDGLTQHTWPETVTLSERAPQSDAIDVFARMEAWAEECGVSIRPPFSIRTTSSTLTDETRTRLTTPVMCLAVYVDDQLANVFPHSRNGDQYSVTDAITALRTDDLELFTVDPDTSASPPDRCPACRSRLTAVQGIGVCQGCNRIELGDTLDRNRRQRSQFANRT